MEAEKIAETEDQTCKLKAWGSAEFDQFYIDPDTFTTRKPLLIDFFLSHKLKISNIACGSQHSLILTSNGQLFSLGSNDEGQ